MKNRTLQDSAFSQKGIMCTRVSSWTHARENVAGSGRQKYFSTEI